MPDRDIILLVGLPLAVGVATVLLRNAADRTYWSFAVALAHLALIVSLVFDTYADLTFRHSALSFLAGLFVPLGAGFAAGRMPALRLHPLAALFAVPACYLAALFISITVAVNLGLPH